MWEDKLNDWMDDNQDTAILTVIILIVCVIAASLGAVLQKEEDKKRATVSYILAPDFHGCTWNSGKVVGDSTYFNIACKKVTLQEINRLIDSTGEVR